MDLDVAYGEVHALVGLNGAGKTTLMRLLLGMLRADSGTVAIGAPWSAVGHTVDEPFGYPDLRTIANLTVAARLRGCQERQWARLSHVPSPSSALRPMPRAALGPCHKATASA
ncbi:ATP-binding cassette domain-containing protein [Ornithinimicrobium cerasi]|uniref:ATP-binding cassette domain-containing protein n=1 Tax=Ornithinimicrobium cerasi TaxID=2248773 RepID=UPI0023519938|nr:ATP-binding cassette domain-containing protein [Ornithinimicrobium cerasi]